MILRQVKRPQTLEKRATPNAVRDRLFKVRLIVLHPIGKHIQAVRPAKPAVPSGHGRRPQPLALNNRFRFCPAAIISPSMFPFVSPRSRNCRIPCHCFASPKLPRGRPAQSRPSAYASPLRTPQSHGSPAPAQDTPRGTNDALRVPDRLACNPLSSGSDCRLLHLPDIPPSVPSVRAGTGARAFLAGRDTHPARNRR